MEELKQASYRSIFKATSIFGGVQVIQIIVNLIKGKFVAILLGSAGMGISALLTSPLSMIITLVGLGLGTSAVRNISQAYNQNNLNYLSRIIKIFRRWLIISCILGTLILSLTSSFLSKYSFGNDAYSLSFILLSLMLIPTLLNQGNTAILQGTRQITYTAQLSLWGSIVSVLTSVPLYYFFGLKGIIPALIIPAWITFFISCYYTNKIKLPTVIVPQKEIFREGMDMAKLGIVMVASVLLGQATVFVFNIFVSQSGNVSDIGFMNAAMGMTTMSISMVFSSMSADYFPRLTAVCADRKAMNQTVNQQGEILLLVATPLLLMFSVFSPILITMLLSEEFQVIKGFIRLLAFGMFFKTASYAIGYISFSMGDRQTFFLLEAVFGNLITLVLNVIGYILGGLNGLAVSFILSYIVYYIVVSVVTYFKYGYRISSTYKKVFFLLILVSGFSLVIQFFASEIYNYILGCLLIIITGIYAYKELDHRMSLTTFIKTKLKI